MMIDSNYQIKKILEKTRTIQNFGGIYQGVF